MFSNLAWDGTGGNRLKLEVKKSMIQGCTLYGFLLFIDGGQCAITAWMVGFYSREGQSHKDP